jgi:hypothetical protein
MEHPNLHLLSSTSAQSHTTTDTTDIAKKTAEAESILSFKETKRLNL